MVALDGGSYIADNPSFDLDGIGGVPPQEVNLVVDGAKGALECLLKDTGCTATFDENGDLVATSADSGDKRKTKKPVLIADASDSQGDGLTMSDVPIAQYETGGELDEPMSYSDMAKSYPWVSNVDSPEASVAFSEQLYARLLPGYPDGYNIGEVLSSDQLNSFITNPRIENLQTMVRLAQRFRAFERGELDLSVREASAGRAAIGYLNTFSRTMAILALHPDNVGKLGPDLSPRKGIKREFRGLLSTLIGLYTDLIEQNAKPESVEKSYALIINRLSKLKEAGIHVPDEISKTLGGLGAFVLYYQIAYNQNMDASGITALDKEIAEADNRLAVSEEKLLRVKREIEQLLADRKIMEGYIDALEALGLGKGGKS